MKLSRATRVGEPKAGSSALGQSEGVLRSSSLSLAALAGTAFFTAVLTVFLVRALGPREYSLFGLALAVGSMVLLPADAGVSLSTQRFAAEHREDLPAIQEIVAAAIRLKLVTGVVACGALFALAQPISAAYHAPGLAWPLRAVAIAVFGQSMLGFLGGLFVALSRVVVNLRLVLAESITEAGASITLVLVGAGAAGAGLGRAVGYTVGALLGAAAVARSIGPSCFRLTLRRGPRTGQLARYAGALFIIDVAFSLFNQIDLILIGALVGTSSVAFFDAPARLCTVLQYPAYSLALGIGPRLAGGGRSVTDEGFAAGLRFILILQSFLLGGIVAWSGPIVHLVLGGRYLSAIPVLRTLGFYVYLSGLGAFLSISVNYLGAARRRVAIAILALVLDIGIDLVLLPRIGVVAGAIATDVGYATYVIGHVIICAKLLNLPGRALGMSFARCLIAAAVMTAVLAAVGTTTLSPAEWLIGAIAGTTAFGVALVVTGELTRSDVAALRALRIQRSVRIRPPG
jgi:O-antigen/teichoic acid export membrane protein